MNRSLRIGLIAEGEAELGASVPYIKPEEGGRAIAREKEGALHTLIRRELALAGLPDCGFVQRHPTTKERGIKLRTGHSVLDPKYLSQVVIAWKPKEVDMILVVVDADDNLVQRQRELDRALKTIRDNHLDANDQSISDRSAGGLAIKVFETWLLADSSTGSKILGVDLEEMESWEDLTDTKDRLEKAIEASTYLAEGSSNQRPLQVCWQLAFHIDLSVLKTCCPNGYAAFVESLLRVARLAVTVATSV
jgi:hypothetical protein